MQVRRLAALATATLALSGTPLAQAPAPNPQNPDMNGPRPIDMRPSPWIEELTWMEVRDLMKAGTNTVIIGTGGVEQNGPYMAAGKHNYVLKAMCPAIAKKLGNALCAPIVPFVPEGNFEPPDDMMRFPATVSVSQATYKTLLTDIVTSYKVHGFEHVVLIGDSGANQRALKELASELPAKWGASKTKVHYIAEYYDYPGLWKWADTTFNWQEKNEGVHDDPTITAILMTIDPNLVRVQERQAKGKASINGIPIVPVEKMQEAGRRIIDYRADLTVAAIRKAVGGAAPSARQ